jgi:hypothetical protein
MNMSAVTANQPPWNRYAGRWRGQVSWLPAVFALLLPKCPFCVVAWLGMAGFAGAGNWLRPIWGMPLTAVLLSVAVASLALRARNGGDARPVLAGGLGAAAMLGGKYGMNQPILVWGGLVLFIAACVWSEWSRVLRRMRSPQAGQGSAAQGATACGSTVKAPRPHFCCHQIGGGR